MTGKRTRRQFLGAVASAAALSGCNSINKVTISENPTPTETPTDTPTESPTEEPTETPKEWEIDPVEHDKNVGAYYYTWYRPEKPNWDRLPDDEPVLGRYGSTNPDVINQHVKWAREHGINWFNISWSREGGGWHDGRFIQDYFLPAELGNEIDFSVFYEGQKLVPEEDKTIDFEREANRQKLHRDFGYFEDEYFGEPNYLTIDGRPVVTFYSAHEFENTADAFEEAKASISSDPLLIGALNGANAINGILHAVDTDATDVFDATTGYMLYDDDIASNGDYSDYVDWAEKELERWALAADHANLDYMPTIVPGLNDTNISGRENTHPILERDPEGFRDLARVAEDRMDPDLNALMITSFNEWPEYTVVEPSEEFGTTYLEIIEEELAQGEEPDYFQPDTHPMLQFRFDRTVSAPEAPIQFGMRSGRLETQDTHGHPVHSYDIGKKSEEPYLLEGKFPAKTKHHTYDSWRWFGGPTEQATIYLHPHSVDGATQAVVNGEAPPFAEEPVGADVYVDGTRTDHITVRPDEPETHRFSLTA